MPKAKIKVTAKVTKKVAPKKVVAKASVKKAAVKKVAPKKVAEKGKVVAKGVTKKEAPKKAAVVKKEAKPLLPLGSFENVKILKATSNEDKIFMEFEVPTSDGSFIERHVGKGDKKKSFYGNVTHIRETNDTMTLINRFDDMTVSQRSEVKKFGVAYKKKIKAAERDATTAENDKIKADKKAEREKKVADAKVVADAKAAVKKVAPKKAAAKKSSDKAKPAVKKAAAKKVVVKNKSKSAKSPKKAVAKR